MSPADRTQRLRERLTAAFAPRELTIVDESHLHVGHAGAAGGGGHFRIRIVADAFAGLPPVARHRRVYEALGDLMTSEVHALSIDARASD
jgi:BolA protein